jgi:glutamyl/glutaminyl-tRNA synthetase
VNWRFRVPDGEEISFTDLNFGPQRFVAGHDFGDFVVWRHDNIPSYQLAVVVDDAAMKISEVVRGEDLLKSTARQLLLYRALNLTPPVFFHCQLVTDDSGVRLAKRHDALSLRSLRASGESPSKLRTHASP